MDTGSSIDVAYAYVQLGLEPGDLPDKAREILANALSYRFSTKARIDHIEKFVEFLAERSRFGKPSDSYDRVRKAYHKQAMAFHPDSNRGNRDAEEKLKIINAAYEIVEAVYKEAREYFKRGLQERQAIENEARLTTQREAQARSHKDAATEQTGRAKHKPAEDRGATRAERQQTVAGVKFMAASIPRYIRNARLPHVGTHAVIGSRLIRTRMGQGLVYDVLMLPEQEFIRAKLYLSLTQGQNSSLELTMSKLTPAYTPMDTKIVIVPFAEMNPYEYARKYFLKEFKLEAQDDSGGNF